MIQKETNNILSLDLLRAVASLAVCVTHMSYATEIQHYSINNILIYGQQGVPIFFVISAFIIPYSLWNVDYKLKNFFSFLAKRWVRITLPFIFIVVVCAILEPRFNLSKFLINIFYLVPFTPYEWYSGIFWTLGVEFQLYIIIGLFFPLIRDANKYVLMVVLLVLGLAGSFVSLNGSYMPIIHNLHYFVFGLITLLIKKQKFSLKEGHILLFSLAAFLCFKISFVTGIVGYLTSIIILHANFKIPFVKFFSKISYSLYLTHTLTADLVLLAFVGIAINAYVLFVILLLSCIIMSLIFYEVFERFALKWSKSIKIVSNYSV
ncbi:acyltransferase family protein [Pedobacter fastidiosus]|uniref:Acyltransferase n=1 Tax=Pedobacter fastidiosus TaxID=2765361 RepID=A0ABR7KWF7_9SPHI|nr:acyltransferase family protein [Pedobacter fastidiosus]MBC6112160.1 acyltransferase [Pedobacter fastidiosus]